VKYFFKMSYLQVINQKRIPNNFWDNSENIKNYLGWLYKKLEFKNEDDWYNIEFKFIYESGGRGLLERYANSVYTLINTLFSEKLWLPWKFKNVPLKFSSDMDNLRWYMDWLYYELKFISMEDWYSVSKQLFNDNYGKCILYHFGDSPIRVVKEIYPCYNWIPWKFKVCTSGFWNDENNHIQYLKWLEKEFKIENLDDWYNITAENIEKKYGNSFLCKNGGFIRGLQKYYPDYEWLPWKFNVVFKEFWNDLSNQKKYMDWLFKELKYEISEDWYNISREIIMQNYGNGLINTYGGSYQKILNTIYPELKLIPWKFNSVPMNFWNDLENQKKYTEWIFKELKYKTMEDFYELTIEAIRINYGAGLMQKYGNSVFKLLQKVYPEYKWELKKFKYYKGELFCKQFLETLYDTKDIIQGFRVKWCKSPKTKSQLPYDFCIEKEKIIIEVDGFQHFDDRNVWKINTKENRENDVYKMKQALENGYSVIRLTWTDIYNNSNNWKNKLKESIQVYESPRVIYLSDKYKEFEEYNSMM
jgi:very-short-patch-repair endonuclease